MQENVIHAELQRRFIELQVVGSSARKLEINFERHPMFYLQIKITVS